MKISKDIYASQDSKSPDSGTAEKKFEKNIDADVIKVLEVEEADFYDCAALQMNSKDVSNSQLEFNHIED